MDTTFDALNESARRTIVALLAQHGELCVCELVAALDDLQPKISRHLSVLRDGGWVIARREGTWMHYRLAALPDWAQTVVAGLCAGGVPLAIQTQCMQRLAAMDARPVRLIDKAQA